jgi:hypothetical protein
MGDSKSGKTGALASLVTLGKYKLRILDYDNGLDILAQVIRRTDASLLANVEFVTLRDPMIATPLGPVVQGTPKAFVNGLKLLDRWKYDSVDLGVPAAWGPETVLVIDSMTFMGDSAYNFYEPLVPKSKDGKFDGRAVYGDAQDGVRKVLELVTSDNFKCNVIVISHVKYQDRPDGTKKGYPTAVGSALSPEIPRYFNSVALAQTVAGARTIQTVPTAMIDLANPASFKMAPTLPIETGLATFFQTVRS